VGVNSPVHLQTTVAVDDVAPEGGDRLTVSLTPAGEYTFEATLGLILTAGDAGYSAACLLRKGTLVGVTLEFTPAEAS
jgi:hypothetical protein